MTKNHLDRILTFSVCGLYLIWSSLFIYWSSYIALDGHRYFGLFDDAMISMRYAWNFAHGLGLVWNAGQPVEGYTNLLMTLLMAAASLFLSKPLAVLAVQILGVFTMLATAWTVKQLANEITDGQRNATMIGTLAMACVLFYYPLNYWTLMGMETGLLALLLMSASFFTLRWLKLQRDRDLLNAVLLCGLAFLARNDSLLLSGMIFGFVLLEGRLRKWDRNAWRKVAYAAALYLVFPVAQTIFRLLYYGQLLPNTYVLKLVNFPLSIRIWGGIQFVLPFIWQTAALLLLGAVALILHFQRVRLLLFSFIVTSLAYQVYTGGDPWPSWRILAPAMPALFLLAILACKDVAQRWSALASHTALAASFVFLLSGAALFLTDLPFLADLSVQAPTSAAIANRVNTNTAIAIDALTEPQATVGVIWAGTLPYYVDRRAIDFLGKSDPYIAHLNADISGAVSWSGMLSVPGHNKYDLNYSIVGLRPTYIQVFSWGDQIVKPWVIQNYLRVEYHGIQGVKTLFLQKDSPYVCWEKCSSEYKLIPWPGQGQDNP